MSDLHNTLISTDIQIQEIQQTQQTQENIIREREKGINQLAIDIGHVSDLFTDLAILVNYQGNTIDNIQTNIENSTNSIDKATTQLIKANKYQIAKHRCRCKCIFFILIILLIIAIIILCR
jgi:t-SNARE complex subunit (syntaxin)